MKTYRISDNTDTIEVRAESATAAVLDYASDSLVALEVTEQVIDEESGEWVDGITQYVIRRPGTADTDDEIGDDPRCEFVHGAGPIETEWLPVWQRQS